MFFLVLLVFTYKSRGLGQAKPRPGHLQWLWPGLVFEKAEATSGQAKPGRKSTTGVSRRLWWACQGARPSDHRECGARASQTNVETPSFISSLVCRVWLYLSIAWLIVTKVPVQIWWLPPKKGPTLFGQPDYVWCLLFRYVFHTPMGVNFQVQAIICKNRLPPWGTELLVHIFHSFLFVLSLS